MRENAKMRQAIIATLLGILLIEASGAAVVSAVASDNSGTNYGFGSMHRCRKIRGFEFL